MKSVYDVVKRPIISEKSTALAEVGNRYVFEVAPMSNKQEIRDAVQRLFSVKVTKVHTMVMHGKMKRVGRFETKRQLNHLNRLPLHNVTRRLRISPF
jgi:large subunit ribosomal protein L23